MCYIVCSSGVKICLQVNLSNARAAVPSYAALGASLPAVAAGVRYIAAATGTALVYLEIYETWDHCVWLHLLPD